MCHRIGTLSKNALMNVSVQWMLLFDAVISHFDCFGPRGSYSFQVIVLGINFICGGKARFVLLNEHDSLVLIYLFSCQIFCFSDFKEKIGFKLGSCLAVVLKAMAARSLSYTSLFDTEMILHNWRS